MFSFIKNEPLTLNNLYSDLTECILNVKTSIISPFTPIINIY